MIYQGSAKHPVNEIIIHCTATISTWWAGKLTSEKVAEVRRWHMSPPNNWKDIGYHFLIDRDGTIAKGRALTTIGAHTVNHNAGTIGISLFGGFGSNENDLFAEHFTVEQDRALRRQIQQIMGQTQIKKISGHNEYAAKACPGFRVSKWL